MTCKHCGEPIHRDGPAPWYVGEDDDDRCYGLGRIIPGYHTPK